MGRTTLFFDLLPIAGHLCRRQRGVFQHLDRVAREVNRGSGCFSASTTVASAHNAETVKGGPSPDLAVLQLICRAKVTSCGTGAPAAS